MATKARASDQPDPSDVTETAEDVEAWARAHDAVSDVQALIALARLLRVRQPRLWEFYFALRRKQRLADSLFQPLHLRRHRGGRTRHDFGRPCQRTGIDESEEGAEQFGIEHLHNSTLSNLH